MICSKIFKRKVIAGLACLLAVSVVVIDSRHRRFPSHRFPSHFPSSRLPADKERAEFPRSLGKATLSMMPLRSTVRLLVQGKLRLQGLGGRRGEGGPVAVRPSSAGPAPLPPVKMRRSRSVSCRATDSVDDDAN